MLDFLGHPIILMALLLTGVWYWRENRRIYELTLVIVRQACQAQGVQLLDATIRLQAVRLNVKPALSIRREYRFEFSNDGTQRLFGWIFLDGDRPRDLGWQNATGEMIYQSLDDNAQS